MKAIVLSCDHYHEITNHMILTYQSIWPSNPLTFRVPWNDEYPQFLKDNYGNKVELIHSSAEFKKTISALTDDLDDNEWIYWCIDDNYMISINEDEANTTHNFVQSVDDDHSILAITFFKGNYSIHSVSTVAEDSIMYKGHQFWRVKVLKRMFDCLREPGLHKAKELHYMQKIKSVTSPFWNMVSEGKWYILDHNIAVFGESTSRGVNMTKNCAQSFERYGLKIPDNFRVSERVTIRE